MLEVTVKVVNRLGLHARAAARLVKLTNGYASLIELERSTSGSTADAKSILSVLGLAAGCGSELVVRVSGEDEHEAIGAVEQMFAEGFGELP